MTFIEAALHVQRRFFVIYYKGMCCRLGVNAVILLCEAKECAQFSVRI